MIEVVQVPDPRGEKLRELVEGALAKTEAQAFFTAVMTDTYMEEEEAGDEPDSD